MPANRLGAYCQFLLPKHWISGVAGVFAACQVKWLKNRFITWFVKTYGVDMSEAVQTDPGAYSCFNDFFTRAINPAVRPLGDHASHILSPADGEISELGRISDGMLIQAKGRLYSLVELLGGDEALAEKFTHGEFITIYLSPRDYHRVHMCASGKALGTTHIPGSLFAVKPSAVRWIPRLFARNKRSVSAFRGEVGHFAQIMVGALIVGSIDLHASLADTNAQLHAGDEFGRFKLGSTVIVLFERGRIEWLQTMQIGKSVKFGEEIARLI